MRNETYLRWKAGLASPLALGFFLVSLAIHKLVSSPDWLWVSGGLVLCLISNAAMRNADARFEAVRDTLAQGIVAAPSMKAPALMAMSLLWTALQSICWAGYSAYVLLLVTKQI